MGHTPPDSVYTGSHQANRVGVSQEFSQAPIFQSKIFIPYYPIFAKMFIVLCLSFYRCKYSEALETFLHIFQLLSTTEMGVESLGKTAFCVISK